MCCFKRQQQQGNKGEDQKIVYMFKELH